MAEHDDKYGYKWWQRVLLAIGIILILAGMGLFFTTLQTGTKNADYTIKQEAPSPLQGKISLALAGQRLYTFSEYNCSLNVFDANNGDFCYSLSVPIHQNGEAEFCIRDDLKLKKSRVMAILHPLKLIIDNYPEDQIEELDVENNLENPELGSRKVPFGRELYIEQEDFMEVPVSKYRRLFPGNEVRLMHAYLVTCTGVDKDEEGNITAVHCTYDPETRGGNAPDGRKVRGTIHWVAAQTALSCQVRLFENSVDEEKGVYDDETGELNLNPNSLQILEDCKVEPSLKGAKAPESFQFVRTGFFCVDSKLNTEEKPVFNRIVSLKSSFKLPVQ